MLQQKLNIFDPALFNYPPAAKRSLVTHNTPPDKIEGYKARLASVPEPVKSIVANAQARREMSGGDILGDGSGVDPLAYFRPEQLKNLTAGVDRLELAIKKQQTIGVVGDFDVDGTTSLATCINTLRSCGANLHWMVPNRFKDGFGISQRMAEELCDKGVKLVILLDHGSQSHKVIDYLRTRGVDVIVIDHHAVSEALPDAIVINPRQPGCGWGGEYPCASTLTTVFCRVIAQRFGVTPPDWGSAAFATIADMVPLSSGSLNRIVARLGLASLAAGSNPGITQLALANKVPRNPEDSAKLEITSEECSFALGPSVNALARIDDATKAVELLCCSDEAKAREIAAQLVAVNEQRKSLQKSSAHRILTELGGSQTGRDYRGKIAVVYHRENHPGVSGLTAQTLAQRFGAPAFVFAKSGKNTLTATARAGNPTRDLHAILAVVASRMPPGDIIKWGGHPAAAGITIREAAFESFQTSLSQVFNELYGSVDLTSEVTADAKLRLSDLTPDLVRGINRYLAPYGNGYPAPSFLFEGVLVNRVFPPSEPGGRFMLELIQDGEKRRCFVGAELWDNEITQGSYINLIGAPATVYRNDQSFVQLSAQAYEITNKPEAATSDALTQLTRIPSATPAMLGLIPTREQHDRMQPQTDRFSGSSAETRIAKAQNELVQAQSDFANEWLYDDLSELEIDPFKHKPPAFWEQQWQAHIKRCGLAINWRGRELRPSHVEALRVLIDRPENHIVQAPTGSGKTDIALSFASRYTSQQKLVIFVAPTIDIVRQVAERVRSLLSIEPLILDGDTLTPDQRRRQYTDIQSPVIVSTPHTLANDLKNEAFKMPSDGLLIVDEAHHAVGDYPAVPLIIHAIQQGTRIVGLTATPGQPDRVANRKNAPAAKRWKSLHDLKELFGVKHIFPLNHPTNRVSLRAVWLRQFDHCQEAIESLTELNRSLRIEFFKELKAEPSSDSAKLAKRLFKSLFKSPSAPTIEFHSEYAVRSLREAMRREYPDDSYKALSILSSITTVADLHQALETRGISSFVAEVLRLRLRQLFPKDPARNYGSRSSISAPQYVTRITEGALLKQAFERVAPPVVRDLWQAQALEKTVGAQTSDWLKLSHYIRAKRYQELLKALNERTFNDLVACDYYDSPKERYLIQRMADERKRYYIAVGRIERAKFLAKRLTTILKDQIALPLTGPGSSTTKGISASERKANLKAINSGRAQHLVCTSCGEEGLDIVMEEGASEEFTSSARSSSQRQGRVARKVSRGDSELSRRMNSSGFYDLLLSSIRDYTRMLSILQKGIAMQMMLNAERSAFSPKSSNSNSGALRTPLLPLEDFK